jgi:DNA-binding NtrC family response regulator
MKGQILLVDDEKALTDVLAERLEKRGYGVTIASSAAEASAAFDATEPDVVVTDINMPGQSGIALCEWVVSHSPDTPVIVITAFGSLETATAAIRAGAYDFVTKPLDLDVLAIAIDRALKHRLLRHEVKRLRGVVDTLQGFSELVGDSPVMVELKSLLVRVAASNASVLITGESGTGKEVVARLLHERGPRRDGPFIAQNCAAVPEHLLESELFGHVRGAFTDAKTDRPGLLVQANRGTLFLDEVGDMPIGLQPKLLRVLEERKVRPVGGNKEIPFDVRLVCATHRDLEDAAANAQFRSDLYFRINVIQMPLPRLRSRGNDILLLAQYFIDRLAPQAGKVVTGLSPRAAERLLSYSWPGNVRELKNAMERAVALTEQERIEVIDLPARIKADTDTLLPLMGQEPEELLSLLEVERRHIGRVLQAMAGNRTAAARILGIDRTTLYKKVKTFGIG